MIDPTATTDLIQQTAQHATTPWVDLSVAAILVLSGLFALLRGLVREVFALGSWLGAGVATMYLFPFVQPWMREQVETPAVADAMTGLAIFCGTLIILIPIGTLCSYMIRGTALTAIDRSLGFVFGVLRGALIVCLIYLLALILWPKDEDQPQWLLAAKTRPAMESGAEIIRGLIPKDKRDKFMADAAGVKEKKQKIEDAEKLLDQLTVPVPADPRKDKPGYDPKQREGLDHLIKSQDEKPSLTP